MAHLGTDRRIEPGGPEPDPTPWLVPVGALAGDPLRWASESAGYVDDGPVWSSTS